MYYEGVFKPTKTDHYNRAAINFVGKKIAVQDGWILKDGPNKGQLCFYLPNSTIGTIPQCDLSELKSIPYVRWKTLFDSIELDN